MMESWNSGKLESADAFEPSSLPTFKPSSRLRWRAILIALPLIAFNDYWVMQVEGIWHTGHPTCISLFWNVMFTLLVLILLNLALKAIAPRFALTQPEFAVIYIMLALSSALAGHDALQLGIPSQSHPWWFATDANKWADLFHQYLPRWCTVPDLQALEGFYEGGSSFWKPLHIKAWLGPMVWWNLFILALAMVYVGLNCFFRRQWTEHEKLSYPIIQLPLSITKGGGMSAFFLNKALWGGFAVGAGIDLMNGLSKFYPQVPYIRIRHAPDRDQRNFFVALGRPWIAVVQQTPLWVPLYPFLIALGYLLPLDLCFSMWFFYLFTKVQFVIADRFEWFRPPEGPPYTRYQCYGAWFALAFHALWMARHHFKEIARELIRPSRQVQAREPMSYRWSALLVLGGLAFMMFFALRAGMDFHWALLYYLVFFIWSIPLTKARAELGPPAHELVPLNSAYFLVHCFGAKRLGGNNLTFFPLCWWFNGRGHRNHQMPIMLEGFKMAQEVGLSVKGMPLLMIASMLLGGVASYLAGLHLSYHAGMKNVMIPHNWGQWNQLKAWIESPQPVDKTGVAFIFLAAGFTQILASVRTRFAWFPFHPAGYALSLNFGVDYFWTCLVIASLLKWVTLHYAGQRGYRVGVPFMFGVILGEYCVGAFWSAYSVIMQDNKVYDFAPG